MMIDDAGFGASSAFGGPCHTPNADRLAARGSRFNRFHTTALCSPTRQSLLTGRNHHSVGMGGITEIATSAPGYNSIRPDNAAPIAETLRLNGYSTAQFGKCHEVPVWETSPMGPFDQWPTGSGFEYFYGFVGAETNQWYPALYEGTTPVEPPKTPEEGYHLTEDLTDQRDHLGAPAEVAHAGQAVLHVLRPGCHPRPSSRAHRVERQVQGPFRCRMGCLAGGDVGPSEGAGRRARRTPSCRRGPPRSRPGTTWPTILKPVLARQMEIYAGFLEHTDHHIGRLIDALEELGVLDDTLIYLHHRGQRGECRRDTQRARSTR